MHLAIQLAQCIVDSVSFAPDSHYLVEINPAGKNDKIISQGSASLKGGTVSVTLENQNSPLSKQDINQLFDTQYTILVLKRVVNLMLLYLITSLLERR